MVEYIKKDTIEKFIKDGLNNPDKSKAFGHDAIEILDEIHFAPAADVVEVKHGRWIKRTHDDGDGVGYILYHCSLCDSPNARKRNYCNNCGAKLDGGKEND